MITTISLPESTVRHLKLLKMSASRRNKLLLDALKSGLAYKRLTPRKCATAYNPRGCRHRIIRFVIPDDLFRIAVSFRCIFRISISRLIAEFLEKDSGEKHSYIYKYLFQQLSISSEVTILATAWKIHPRKTSPPH
jgi:hypothetical protein